MGNGKKVKNQGMALTPEVQQMVESFGFTNADMSGMTMATIIQKAAELDLRRQAQVQAQVTSINRLLAMIFDDGHDPDGDKPAREIVFTVGGQVRYSCDAAEVGDDGKLYVALKREGKMIV